ncbi:hypothetical protein HDU88_003006 [Geranomyces variabilis]|nr:hypothetical protein HDU88_003006 [Geranomyces variabilis]
MEQQYNSQLQNQRYADQQAGTDRGLFSDLGQRLNPSSSAPSSSQQHAGSDDNKNLKIGIGGVLGAVAVAGVGYLAYEAKVVVQQWLKHQGKTHSNETVDHFQKLQASAPSTAAAGVTTATAAHGKEEKKDKKDKKDKKEKKDHKEKKDKKDKKHKDNKHKGDSSSSSSSSSSDSD